MSNYDGKVKSDKKPELLHIKSLREKKRSPKGTGGRA